MNTVPAGVGWNHSRLDATPRFTPISFSHAPNPSILTADATSSGSRAQESLARDMTSQFCYYETSKPQFSNAPPFILCTTSTHATARWAALISGGIKETSRPKKKEVKRVRIAARLSSHGHTRMPTLQPKRDSTWPVEGRACMRRGTDRALTRSVQSEPTHLAGRRGKARKKKKKKDEMKNETNKPRCRNEGEGNKRGKQ